MAELSETIRMCSACRAKLPKKELIRIVKDKSGNINIDFSFKADGRGVYLCKKPECIETARKKRCIERAFKCQINPEIYSGLARSVSNSKEQTE